MQTGFGMLEAGCVSEKNIANIMVKNVVDVTLGGITYWSLGYGLSFGPNATPFVCWGHFFVNYKHGPDGMGSFYSHYVFHFSFATAATTIVSGAVAERMKLEAYMVFSAINTFIYALPASWVWNAPHGFLGAMGFYDFAGAAVVHMVGGSSAIAATWILGARNGRFGDRAEQYGMSSPVTALTGTFMLWWAWLSFNCGSTFGISGDSWKVAAKVGVNTLNGSIGGSFVGLIMTYLMTRKSPGGYYFDISITINSILGGLLGVTACCAVIDPTESLFIGGIGALIAVLATPLVAKIGIDDPVGAIPVHFCAGVWSVLSVGIFARNEFDAAAGPTGLIHGGGLKLLGVQALGAFIIAAWSFVTTLISFIILDKTIGVRMHPEEEEAGADASEHRVMKPDSQLATARINKLLEKITKSSSGRDNSEEDTLKELMGELISQGLNQGGAQGIRNFTGVRSQHIPRSHPHSETNSVHEDDYIEPYAPYYANGSIGNGSLGNGSVGKSEEAAMEEGQTQLGDEFVVEADGKLSLIPDATDDLPNIPNGVHFEETPEDRQSVAAEARKSVLKRPKSTRRSSSVAPNSTTQSTS